MHRLVDMRVAQAGPSEPVSKAGFDLGSGLRRPDV